MGSVSMIRIPRDETLSMSLRIQGVRGHALNILSFGPLKSHGFSFGLGQNPAWSDGVALGERVITPHQLII
jgi:hypothetical protein